MIKLPPRYKAKKELAGGGMSHTWLCHDENLKRNVVAKSVKPGISNSKLMDELIALSAIRSKYVVQLLDVLRDTSGEIYAFVEEFIDGNPLTCEKIADPKLALAKLHPIAAGIADIHAHGLLHRDLKPDNMKIDTEGVLKIYDFGLAKIENNPGTKVLYFSPNFTAPEAFQKNTKGFYEYSRPTDAFAFGAIAWWLLNEGSMPASLGAMPPSLSAGSVDFSALPCGLPAQVATLLNRTLAAIPADRPPMEEVRDVLGQHLLLDQHKMLLTSGASTYWVDASNRSTTLSSGGASISIHYDGLEFRITAVTGSVVINNNTALVGAALTGAAVIVLNGTTGRLFITADVSHPEVM